MKTKTVVDATETLQASGFPVEQANAQVRVVGSMTDHLVSKEDLDAKLLMTKKDLETKIEGTRKDLETIISKEINKVILTVIGVNLALAAALRWWPGVA